MKCSSKRGPGAVARSPRRATSPRRLAAVAFALASAVMVAAGLVTPVIDATPASATSQGDPMPDVAEAVPTEAPQATCVVVGELRETNPSLYDFGPGSYGLTFYDFRCVDTAGLVITYDVLAHGAMWGPLGASASVSWSDGGDYLASCDASGDVTNKGEISAQGVHGTSYGWVKFVRELSHMTAWGTFCDGGLEGMSFTAEMSVNPHVIDDWSAEVRGTAVLYTTEVPPA